MGAACAANAGAIWQENFNYDNGGLLTVGGGVWAWTSGTTTPLTVTEGQITGMSSGGGSREDVLRPLGATYATGSLYAGFDMSLGTAPTSGCAYFLHFKNDETVFRGRVFIGAPSATGYRLGLETDAGDSGSTVLFTDDLALNTLYRVVVAYDVGAGTSKLWVNGVDEASPTLADPTAATTTPAMTQLGLRQGGGSAVVYGDLTIDNLGVATDFYSVVPEPSTWATLLLGGGALVWFRRRLRA